MKTIYKAVVFSVFGLAGVIPSKATSYDLLIGLSTQSGTDLIYDLGTASSLSNGETWNLGSLLTGAGLAGSLSTINWGVIGNANNADGFNPQATWVTTASLSAPPTINGGDAFNAIDTSIISIESANFGGNENSVAGNSATPSANSANSWNTQTISGTLPNNFVNAYRNPNVIGLTSDYLWQVNDNNSTPTDLGSFSLNGSGVVTFNVAPVPEPSSLAIVAAGGGFLMLSLRNKFRSKKS